MEYVHIRGAKIATGMSESSLLELIKVGKVPGAFRKADKNGKPHFWYIPASWVIQNTRSEKKGVKLKIEHLEPPSDYGDQNMEQAPERLVEQVVDTTTPQTFQQVVEQDTEQFAADESIPLETDIPTSSIPVDFPSDEELPPPPTPQPAKPQDARDKYIGVLEELVKERKKEVKEVTAAVARQGQQVQPQVQPVSTPSAGGSGMAGIRNIKLYFSDKQSGELVYLAPLPFFPDDPIETIRKMVSDPGYYVIEWEQIGANNVWFKHNKEYGPLAEGLGTLTTGRAPMRPMGGTAGTPVQVAPVSGMSSVAEKAVELLMERGLEKEESLPADASAYKDMADKTAEMFMAERKRQEDDRQAERARVASERETERIRLNAEIEKMRAQAKIDQEMMLARMEKQAAAEKQGLASIMSIMETSHTQRLKEKETDANERKLRDETFFKSMLEMEQNRSKEHIDIQTKILESEREKNKILKENDDRFFGLQKEMLEMQKKHLEELRALQDRSKPWEYVAQAVAKIAEKVELKVGQAGGPPIPVGQMGGVQERPRLPQLKDQEPPTQPQNQPQSQPQEEQMPAYTVDQLRKMTDEQLIAETKNSPDFMTLLGYLDQAIPYNYNRNRFLTQLLDGGGNTPEIRFKVRAITRLPDIMTFFEPPFFTPKINDPAEQARFNNVIADQLKTVKVKGAAWLADFCKVAQQWASDNPEFF